MADVSADKKQKLANTKKRFKELQELKKKRHENVPAEHQPANSNQSSNRNTPIDQNFINIEANIQQQIPTDVAQVAEEISQIDLDDSEFQAPSPQNQEFNVANYFTENNAQFFDSISPDSHLLTYFNSDNPNPMENIGLPCYFDSNSNGDNIWENTKQQGQEEDYHLFPATKTTSKETEPDVVSLNYQEIEENNAKLFSQSYDSPGQPHKLIDYLNTTGATEQEKSEICHTNQEIDDSSNLTKKEIQENLQQLSNQLAHIIEPSYDYSNPTTNLENRNLDLAQQLSDQTLACKKLQQHNTELQAQLSQLQQELNQQHEGNELQSTQQLLQLRTELQNHLQTIGLLVAEKTELSASLGQFEVNFKQKILDNEELQARLRTSRARVADLERELGVVKAEKAQTDQVGEQLEMLKQEYRAIKEQKEELAQDLLEVREKLKGVVEENLKLQRDNKEVTGKLDLAEIKIQQLSSGLPADSLAQEKLALQNDLANLNQMLKSIIKERDESTVQYQQYAQQLNAQIANLSEKLEQLQQDKEHLLEQEQQRIKHIGNLERQLQNIQNEQTYSRTSSDVRQELEKVRELSVQLQIDKTTAEEQFTKVSNERNMLLQELTARVDSISQLETLIEQLKHNQPDSAKLVATMESDKVAASRATEQNKELKQQMESLQQVMRKMDDDKVELTENLKAQQMTNKELIDKLQRTELSLQHLADAIEIKDTELTHLRQTREEMDRQALQHNQLEDRLRHYEAHDNSSQSLQEELQQTKAQLREAKASIVQLSNTTGASIVQLSNPTEDSELTKENTMHYLEEKVKKTMQEIADLSDEKQRLEHIVMQLQGETETIGEYVALYQHQRMILKQRALEKDLQLKQLATDREEIKLKLDRLNQLVRQLVVDKNVPAELLQHLDNACEEHTLQNNVEPPGEAAEEIITLLSEIKASNLVQPDDRYHHCPWCSGQLMTV